MLSLPEELIERIFDEYFSSPLTAGTPQGPVRTPISTPLLTCKVIYRVSAPLLYRTITLRSPTQTSSLVPTFTSNPSLAGCVRALVVEGVWETGLKEVCQACTGLRELHIVLDDGWRGKALSRNTRYERGDTNAGAVARELNESEAIGFCDALRHIRDLKNLRIRKDANTYLTQVGPATILRRIGECVQQWPDLVSTSTFDCRYQS